MRIGIRPTFLNKPFNLVQIYTPFLCIVNSCSLMTNIPFHHIGNNRSVPTDLQLSAVVNAPLSDSNSVAVLRRYIGSLTLAFVHSACLV